MSLILDALNRADNERKNQTPVPDLSTQHRPLTLEAPPASPRHWLWGLVLMALVLVAIASWQIYQGLAPSSAAPVVASASSQSVSSLPSQPLEVPPPAVPVSTAPLASTLAVQTETSQSSAAEINNLYAEATAPAPAIDADVSELYAQEEAEPVSESVRDPFASLPVAEPQPAQLVVEVEREAARTFDNMTHIQDFNDLPWNTKQKMPTISYQRHDYLVGGISSVVINGQTVGVGNIVSRGQFIVQDILVDGVVLKHGDRVFKLRALNGWINM